MNISLLPTIATNRETFYLFDQFSRGLKRTIKKISLLPLVMIYSLIIFFKISGNIQVTYKTTCSGILTSASDVNTYNTYRGICVYTHVLKKLNKKSEQKPPILRILKLYLEFKIGAAILQYKKSCTLSLEKKMDR